MKDFSMLFQKFRSGLIAGICLFGAGSVSCNAHSQEPTVELAKFPRVTPWTEASWAVQMIFAPRTLDNVVPMYAYQIGPIREKLSGLYGGHVAFRDVIHSISNQEIPYIALLPPGKKQPQGKEQPPPANCGIVWNNEGLTLQQAVNYFKQIRESRMEKALAESYRCNIVDAKPLDNVDDWYIAVATPDSIVGDSAPPPRTLVWTKTDAWIGIELVTGPPSNSTKQLEP